MTTPVDVLAPLHALIEESRKHDELKFDYEQPLSALSFAPNGGLVAQEDAAALFRPGVNSKTAPMPMNENAFAQWRGLFGPDLVGSNGVLSKRDWEGIRANWPSMFADMANSLRDRRITRAGDKSLLIRTHDNTVRGLLSDRYLIFDNTQMLEIVDDLMGSDLGSLPEMRIRASNVGVDDLYFRLTVRTDKNNPNAPDGGGNYAVGLYLGNSEVGRRSVIVRPMIQRTSCANSITFADSMVQQNQTRFYHMGSQAAMLAKIKLAIGEALPYSFKALEAVYAATARELPGLFSLVHDLSDEHGWSETLTDAVMQGTEGQRTHMALVNGVTYAAHQAASGDDQREMMEALGGTLLMTPVQKLAQRAQRYEASRERELARH